MYQVTASWRRIGAGPYTTEILWPNYHSGAHGDYQEIRAVGVPHPVLAGPVRYLPAHPHEGGVGAPPGDPGACVIATGRSKVTDCTFNIAVAFEPSALGARAIAESTFHHFAKNVAPVAGESPHDRHALISPLSRRSVGAERPHALERVGDDGG